MDERWSWKLGAVMYCVNNKVNGDNFEELIEISLSFYRERGIACILKTPEPFKTIEVRKDGRVTGFYMKKAHPDFKGVVTEVQTKLLDEHQKLNALCFVMVSLEMRFFYRVPWIVWKNMKQRFGHRFMTKEELGPYKIKEYRGRLLLLDGIELEDIELKGVTNEQRDSGKDQR